MDFTQTIENLKQNHGYQDKVAMQLTFGDKKTCKDAFTSAFKAGDKTVKKFEWLPEYDSVVEWMVDNQGKGLAMFGSVGRGKSVIMMHVLPLVFMQFHGKVFRSSMASDLAIMKIEQLQKLFKQRPFIAIDELGRETRASEWGEKHEGLNYLIEHCEAYQRLLFITSNMTRSQVTERYGSHIWDRIVRLCKIVEFKGKSLRE
jgi:DNA replication protein DnaC